MRINGIAAGLVGIVCIAGGAPACAQALDPVFANGFESGLIAFGPALSSVATGTSGVASAYVPLRVTLDAAAVAPTFVTITSSDPTRLAVSGGGVTVATGQSSASVLVDGLIEDASPVTLWAQLGNTLGASVRVERALNESGLPAEADYCVVQFPASLNVVAGTPSVQIYGRLYEAGLTEAAGTPPGWTAEFGYGPQFSDPRLLSAWRFVDATYNMQVGNDDEFQAGITAPWIPGLYSYAYRFSGDAGASWTYCDTDGAGTGASFDFSASAQGTMTVIDPYAGLVINEIDYDNVGTDSMEFVELFNSSANTIDLSSLALVFINGVGGVEYARYAIGTAGMLDAGQYFVLHSPVLTVPMGVPHIAFPVSDSNIQNGAPDGVALVDIASQRVLDALSYEGSINAAVITGFPDTYNLVHGTAFAGADSNTTTLSLIRSPDGTSTNNDVLDWTLTSTPTPGAANVFTP
ncbi:MAG: lamin tail domain-containing protein [Dokdonella sp.]